MSIPANVVFAFNNTVANIPAGWSRETALDGKFVRGVDGDAGGTGGSGTHTHTATDHNHTSTSHTHTTTVGTSTDTGTYPATGGMMTFVTASNHGHGTAVTSGATTPTISNQSISFEAMHNNPPYKEVLWIKSDGTPNQLPNKAVGFFENETPPTDFDLLCENRYLRGAPTGQNPDSEFGGGTMHSHDEDGTHTHSQQSHTHTGGNTNAVGRRDPVTGTGTEGVLNTTSAHTHPINYSTDGAGNTGTGKVYTQITTVEPPYYKLSIIENTSGGATDLPEGVIALWLGTEVSIPTNWSKIVFMDGKFVKGFADDGDNVGDTGGSLQHTHTADEHNHTGYQHNHGASTGNPSSIESHEGPYDEMVVPLLAKFTHSHPLTISNVTPAVGNTTITVNNCASGAALPEYVESLFIKYTEPSTSYQGQVIMIMS